MVAPGKEERFATLPATLPKVTNESMSNVVWFSTMKIYPSHGFLYAMKLEFRVGRL